MPINFKYLPLAPEPLSGPAFIEQTETAFNELGAEIDANTATANEALATANNAAQVAENALETAQDTVSTANTALTTANTALSNSTTAINTANTAYDNAANAVSVSNAANTTANAANTTANAANATATQAAADTAAAVVVADNALNIANNALTIASSANDTYIVNAGEVDADEFYVDPERDYLTNTANVNFPISMPCFFNVIVTSDENAATQQCWNDETTLYRRYATIDNTDPDNPDATWSSWEALGSGGVRIATDEEAEAGILETVAVNPKQLVSAAGSGGGGMPNTRLFLYTAQNWRPPIDGWYRITLVGGGGGGGGGGAPTVTTAGNIVGAGGGGGAAGEVGIITLNLKATDGFIFRVGAGGDNGSKNTTGWGATAGSNGGASHMTAVSVSGIPAYSWWYVAGGGGGRVSSLDNDYVYSGGGGGYAYYFNRQIFGPESPGYSPDMLFFDYSTAASGFNGDSGCSLAHTTVVPPQRANGGNGGNNGTGFGAGGGGGPGLYHRNGGAYRVYGNPGEAGGGTDAIDYQDDPITFTNIYDGANRGGSTGAGGKGGDGVVMIEYFDPNA